MEKFTHKNRKHTKLIISIVTCTANYTLNVYLASHFRKPGSWKEACCCQVRGHSLEGQAPQELCPTMLPTLLLKTTAKFSCQVISRPLSFCFTAVTPTCTGAELYLLQFCVLPFCILESVTADFQLCAMESCGKL